MYGCPHGQCEFTVSMCAICQEDRLRKVLSGFDLAAKSPIRDSVKCGREIPQVDVKFRKHDSKLIFPGRETNRRPKERSTERLGLSVLVPSITRPTSRERCVTYWGGSVLQALCALALQWPCDKD